MLHDIVARIITDPADIPVRSAGQRLHPIRAGLTGPLD
jgi:hypothetical protein